MRLSLRESRLKTFRLNELPLGAMIPLVYLPINGDWTATARVRLDSVTFVDAINDEPNTLSFRVEGTPPPADGMSVILYVGTLDPENLWFSGTIISVQQVYESVPKNLAYDVQAIDFQWLLKKATVLRKIQQPERHGDLPGLDRPLCARLQQRVRRRRDAGDPRNQFRL